MFLNSFSCVLDVDIASTGTRWFRTLNAEFTHLKVAVKANWPADVSVSYAHAHKFYSSFPGLCEGHTQRPAPNTDSGVTHASDM